MGSVVALDAFRETTRQTVGHTDQPPRPEIRGGDIWGRDYRDIEAVVFGLLKVRAIVAHHMGCYETLFDAHAISALEAAYEFDTFGPVRLKESVAEMKEWILAEIEDENKRDMSWALVILDLIEKSPAR